MPPPALPTPTVTLGPLYAQEINDAITWLNTFATTPIPFPAGVSVLGSLNMGGYGISGVASLGLNAAVISTAATLSTRTIAGNKELFWNDSTGHQIPITAAGSVAGAAGNITNLVAPASITWSGGAPGTFTFRTTGTQAATIQCGPVKLMPTTDGATIGVTLLAPTALVGNYAWTLPAAALPSSTVLLDISNTGQLGYTVLQPPAAVPSVESLLAVSTSGLMTYIDVPIALATISSSAYSATGGAPGVGKLVQANGSGLIDNSLVTPPTYHVIGTGGGQLAPATGWAATTAGYWIDNQGCVHLQGKLVNTAGTGAALLLTLPAGFSPANAAVRRCSPVMFLNAVGVFWVEVTGSATTATVALNSFLTTYIPNTGDFVCLDGISFLAGT